MVYGYIRVSSDKQTVENQRYEISNFCSKEGSITNFVGFPIPLVALSAHIE